MKTTPNDNEAIHMPPELLAQARQAANEEHRPADELVSDAVRRYLQERKRNEVSSGKNLAQLLEESPFSGANLDLERRKGAEAARTSETQTKRTLLDLFKPLRGLDVEFPRNPSTGRPVDL